MNKVLREIDSSSAGKPALNISVHRPLIEKDGYFVMVSHQELDELVGRLMQMFELIGDVEQRNALKQETKWRSREWLDSLYSLSGYRDHALLPGAKIINLNAISAE